MAHVTSSLEVAKAPAEAQAGPWLHHSAILSGQPASGYGLHPQHGHIQGHKEVKAVPNPWSHSDRPEESVGFSQDDEENISSGAHQKSPRSD